MLSMAVLLRSGLSKMWLTGRICGPAQPLLLAIGLKIYLFLMLAIVFLSNLLMLVFYINFNH